MQPPPQQWYNNGPHIPGPHTNRPQNTNMKPMLPAGFPQIPIPQMPMPKWSPAAQQNPNYLPPNKGMHPHSFNRYPQPPPSRKFTNEKSVNKAEPKKKSTPFVPLQAQKKNRNIASAPSSSGTPSKSTKKDLKQNKSDQKSKENTKV